MALKRARKRTDTYWLLSETLLGVMAYGSPEEEAVRKGDPVPLQTPPGRQPSKMRRDLRWDSPAFS